MDSRRDLKKLIVGLYGYVDESEIERILVHVPHLGINGTPEILRLLANDPGTKSPLVRNGGFSRNCYRPSPVEKLEELLVNTVDTGYSHRSYLSDLCTGSDIEFSTFCDDPFDDDGNSEFCPQHQSCANWGG